MKRIYLTLTILGCTLLSWGQQKPINHISEETLNYIKKAADGDHLALEGGHLALDGHVMPYPFFQSHEVLYLYRLSQLRHHKIWLADSMLHKPDWSADYLNVSGTELSANKVSANHLSGDRHSYDTYWLDIPELPKSETGWERFFCLKPIEMSLPGWPETTIHVNGKPKAALMRQHFYWSTDALLDESTSNQICLKSFGIYDEPRGYREISIVERDPQIDELYWYMRVLVEAASIMQSDDTGYTEIRSLADDIMARLDLDLSGSSLFRTQLSDLLMGVKSRFEKIESMAGGQPVLKMLLHGHLDSAWRWTLDQTDEKIERLVLNNLYLMDRYPEYRYIFTSPYHYERLQQLYPELFARVKEKIAQGQWIANGSTYVETDMNLPGGESIVRQFLYGMAFYENELSVTENTLFLPDTFGYPRFLPQVAQGFGLDHLIGMRVNTDETEHIIYRWKGIDGTEILVNGLSTPAWEYPFVNAVHGYRINNPEHYTTYNAPDPGPRRLKGTWNQFKDKQATDNQLLLIGWGDGGGGGTEDQVEIKRLASSLPSFPKLEWTNMYDYINEQKFNKDNFAVFDKRIIASRFIQRTFSMASGIKTANRKAEQRLREAEALAAWAAQSGYEYPTEKFETLWKSLLLHHFHDIITGMAVPEVLSLANETINEIEQETKLLRDEAFDYLCQKQQVDKDGVLVFNPSGVEITGLVAIPNVKMKKGHQLTDQSGKTLLTEMIDGELKVEVTALAPMAFTPLYWSASNDQSEASPSFKGNVLENELVKITLNTKGEISSYIDKEWNRELVPAGKVWNRLFMAEHGNGGQSFKREINMDAKVKFGKSESNQSMATIQINRNYNNSTITQKLILPRTSKQLSFETNMDWKEAHYLIADFPLEMATDVVNHGIQWGVNQLSRTAYVATDSLHVPICAHEWVDISDQNYGVAVFDKVRYGYDVKKEGIRLIISYGQHRHGYEEIDKLEWNPTSSGDQGGEEFSYAVFPHIGTSSEANVVQKAKAFNTQIIAKSIDANTETSSITSQTLIRGLPENIVLQTIKQSENGEGIIVRMYETEQKSTSSVLSIHLDNVEVFATNLKEEIQSSVPIENGQVELSFKPFEIKTILLK